MNAANSERINAIIREEQQRMKIEAFMHHLAGLCWDQCVKSPTSLSSSDKTCVTNCSHRLMESNAYILSLMFSDV